MPSFPLVGRITGAEGVFIVRADHPQPAPPPAAQGPSPPTAPPPQRPFLSTTKGLLTVLGTLVAIIGTLITTFIAVQDRPAPYRLADWAQSANAACDTGRATVSTDMGRVNDAIAQALSADVPDTEAAAQQAESGADYYKRFIGPLRGIRLPTERSADIAAAFRLTDELDQRFYAVADLIRQMDPYDMTAEPLRSELLAGMDSLDQQFQAVASAFRALGATSCAVVPH